MVAEVVIDPVPTIEAALASDATLEELGIEGVPGALINPIDPGVPIWFEYVLMGSGVPPHAHIAR